MMNINIPDKVYKLLILIGLILIGYSIYKLDFVQKTFFSKIDNHLNLLDSISLTNMQLKHEKQNLIEISNFLSKSYEIKNPIIQNDSVFSFDRVLIGQKNELKVSDSIYKLWNNYNENEFKAKLLLKKLEFSSEYMNREKNLKLDYAKYYRDIFNLGLVIFFIGIVLWTIDNFNKPSNSKIVKQHEKLYPFCQSCGQEYSSMLNYSTNKDKSINYAFCENCFKGGKFTKPKLTKEEFLEVSMNSINDRNRLTKWLLKIRFKNLERWNNQKY